MNRYLPENLKNLRQKNGFSPDYVARMIGVSPETVAAWESGRSAPAKGDLGLLAKLYSVEVSVLLSPTRTTPAPEAESLTAEKRTSACREAHTFGEESSPKEEPHPDPEKIPPHTEYANPGREAGTPADKELSSFLSSGEKILWSGSPDLSHNVSNKTGSFFVAVFAFLWFGFAIFWTVTATAMAGFMGIFGIFFLIGVGYAFFGIRTMLQRLKKNTYYAITNRRVLCYVKDKQNTFHAYSYAEPLSLLFESGKEGYGSIYFYGVNPFRYGANAFRFNRKGNLQPAEVANALTRGFIDIKDADRVYQLLQTTYRKFRENEKTDWEHDRDTTRL